MMEKNVAISILEDINRSLMSNNWKENALSTIDLYKKGLEVATNEKIKRMINIHSKYIEKYGNNHIKTRKLGKKINDEVQKIYNKKI